MRAFTFIQSRFKSFHIVLFFLFILSSLFLLVVVSNTNDLPATSSYPQQASAQGTECTKDDTANWCQVQRTPQRTGNTPEVLCTNYPNNKCPSFPVVWTYPFQPDRVYPQVQAIIYQGKVFVGTEGANTAITGNNGGTMYAFDAVNPDPSLPAWNKKGKVLWKYSVGAPILASVAAGDGKVFFGAMDGAVYALNVSDGSLVWKKQLSQSVKKLGFSTAPVLAEGKIMLGGRNGIFYALDVTDGHVVWQYNIGYSILQTAAYDNPSAGSGQGGKVFFGAMDMYVYGLNTSDGTLAWKSGKIPGIAFADYWPIVYNGMVIIRQLPDREGYPGIKAGFPFGWYNANGFSWLATLTPGTTTTNGETIAAGNFLSIPGMTINGKYLAGAQETQDNLMASYYANPKNITFSKSMFILNEDTGKELDGSSQDTTVPHWSVNTMHGGVVPSCVDRDGNLIVPVDFVKSAWGRLNLTSKRIVDILYDNTNSFNHGPVDGTTFEKSTPSGMGNADENLNVTCSKNLIFAFHTTEGNAHYTGIFDLDNRWWTHILAGHKNLEMTSNARGGGGNPVSIANGLFYHISFYELIVRTTK